MFPQTLGKKKFDLKESEHVSSWMTWMRSGEKTFTPSGQLRAASLVTVCQWVKESWQDLSKEMVDALLRNVEFQMPWTEPKMI